MGKPTSLLVSLNEYIVLRSERGEVKHLSTPRKRNQRDSLSSGERTGISPNLCHLFGRGVVGPQYGIRAFSRMVLKNQPKKVIAL
jgi:hypothetical protein